MRNQYINKADYVMLIMMFCLVAFDEYVKDIATVSRRTLIVPDRYDFCNLTATAYPWQQCLESSGEVVKVVLNQHASWQMSQCKDHLFVKLVRCRKSSRKNGCVGLPKGISNCSNNMGLDRCLVLNGIVFLKVF